MFHRMFRSGLSVLVAGALSPAGMAMAQMSDDSSPVSPPGTAPNTAAPRPTSGLPGSAKRMLRDKKQKVEDGDVWKKHPPVWSLHDPSPYTHPYATQIYVAPGLGAYPGGPAGQFGSPYYYTANAQYAGAGIGQAGGFGPAPYAGGGYVGTGSGLAPAFDGGVGASYGGPGYGAPGYGGPGYGDPGFSGYSGGLILGGGVAGGAQMAAVPGTLPGNPYLYHFGPGYYRYQEAGHYRFPYYSYRRPWYFPGHPSYNRDTNIPW